MKSEDVVCRSLNLGEAGSILLFKHQTGAALVVLGELLQQPLRNIERQGRNWLFGLGADVLPPRPANGKGWRKVKLTGLGVRVSWESRRCVWSKYASVHHFEGYLLNEFVHIILLEDIWDFVVQGILQKVGILAKINLPQALLIYIIEGQSVFTSSNC